MRFSVLILLMAITALSACNSRWNPQNWFNTSTEETVDLNNNPLIPENTSFLARPEEVYPGIPVATVTELKVERVADGAIIRAAGVAHVQGAFNVKLRPINNGEIEGGVLTYELLAIHPSNGIRGGTPASRTVTVAVALTDQQLEGVRTIKVMGTENARTSRR